tara:strand:- start:9640 stop:10101 length:462 start_codon:yes stop_codon:yes gene_type:complete
MVQKKNILKYNIMVVENLKTFIVVDYKALWKLYKQEDICVLEQRLPENLKKMKVGRDGTDEELIIKLLYTDTDNVYHVAKIECGFKITILGFAVNVEIIEPVENVYLHYGEDGVWKEVKFKGDKEYQDANSSADIQVFSGYDKLKTHDIKLNK